jgi:uncharacterized protein with von Willebrand factor type A (vWA) domain
MAWTRSSRRAAVPDASATLERADADRLAVAFVRVLRGLGLDVTVDCTRSYGEALVATGIDRRSSAYWAGRATLIRRFEDVADYDCAFTVFWDAAAEDRADDAAAPVRTLAVAPDDPSAEPGRKPPAQRVRAVRWSATEVLRDRDFAAYTPAEFDEARRVLRDLRLPGLLRRSRRLQPVRRSRGRNPRLDLRRTVRRSLPAGGELIDRAYRARGERPRRVVLLCDVSGSMEPYARAMVRFLHAAVAGGGRVEAFALGTRLTRITRELSSRDPDAALRAAAAAVRDWSGGTRLGSGLREFNDRWGVGGMARGSMIVIVSDGWDRGDVAQLGEQMARLRRVAHRIVWVNPLKASPGFAPVAAGMAAALPFVDEFVEGHSLGALEQLAALVGGARTRS